MSTTVAQSLACLECLYDLHGLPAEGRCPECGTDISVSTQPDPALAVMVRPLRWTAIAGAVSIFCLPGMIAAIALVVWLLRLLQLQRDEFLSFTLTLAAMWVVPTVSLLLVFGIGLRVWRPIATVTLDASLAGRLGSWPIVAGAFCLLCCIWFPVTLASGLDLDTQKGVARDVKRAVLLFTPLLGGVAVPVAGMVLMSYAVSPVCRIVRRPAWQAGLRYANGGLLSSLLLASIAGMLAIEIVLDFSADVLAAFILTMLAAIVMLVVSSLLWVGLMSQLSRHVGRLLPSEAPTARPRPAPPVIDTLGANVRVRTHGE